MSVAKVKTGIAGFDDITRGGLPQGRTTLVCGGPGCGKTLFAMEFLVRGARDHDQPGALISFEESVEQITTNVESLGFDVEQLAEDGLLSMDHITVNPADFIESGTFDLEGLFVRIGFAIDAVGAKRVVLDTVEVLFGIFDETLLRAELNRLFQFLKSRGVTAVITGEQGDGRLTRYGLEEYVSDCVVFLDHRIEEQVSTRRLRVVKYRGSAHETREFPFIIDEEGFQVLPVTAMRLEYDVSDERVSTGVDGLDEMLGGGGVYRASSVLVSGTSGTGKTTLSAMMVAAACERGERAMFFSFEESPAQIVRNLRSVGLDLQQHVDSGLLRIESRRAEFLGLETHLLTLQREIARHEPTVVVIDPMNALIRSGELHQLTAMLLRLVDFLKSRGITGVFNNIYQGPDYSEEADVQLSSLMDTWILLRAIELEGERNRGLFVLKSRGMPHSNQIREFRLTEDGVELLEVYVGPEGVLTGAARRTREASESAERNREEEELVRLERELQRKQRLAEARLAAIQAEMQFEIEEIQNRIRGVSTVQRKRNERREEMRRHRSGSGSQ